MQFDLDVTAARSSSWAPRAVRVAAVARFVRGGARVTLVATGDLPAERQDTVRYVRAPGADDTSACCAWSGPAWLVVSVDPPAALRERVAELAGHLRVMTTTEEPAETTGSVTLVGGGPGRTGLLTLEAVAALAAADVVFFDRLAPTDDLAGPRPGRRARRRRQDALPPPGRAALDRGSSWSTGRGPGSPWSGSRAATPSSSAAGARRCSPASPRACRCASCPGSAAPSPCRRPAASRSPTAGSATRSPSSPATSGRARPSSTGWPGSAAPSSC